MSDSPLKLALTTDDLIERDVHTYSLDMLAGLYPQSSFYTFAHQAGQLMGTVETKRIFSTGLSRMAKSRSELKKKLWLLPSFSKQIQVSCESPVIFNLSRGFSHGLPRCQGSTQITMFLDHELEQNSEDWKTFLFQKYLKKWQEKKARENVTVAVVANERLKNKWQNLLQKEVELLLPCLKLSDFPIIPGLSKQKMGVLIDAEGLGLNEAERLASEFAKEKIKFKFIGHDDQLDILKQKIGFDKFYGDRCSGEAGPMLASATCLLSVGNVSFPENALYALASGTPVIAKRLQGQLDYLDRPFVSFMDSLEDIVREVRALETTDFEAKKVSAQVNQFHDTRFRAKAMKLIEAASKAEQACEARP